MFLYVDKPFPSLPNPLLPLNNLGPSDKLPGRDESTGRRTRLIFTPAKVGFFYADRKPAVGPCSTVTRSYHPLEELSRQGLTAPRIPWYLESMTVRSLPKDNRFVTSGDWESYGKFLEAIGDRPIRVTYDRGALEIMSPSHEHERLKTLVGRMLECLVEELGWELEAGGSMTFRRPDLDRGLEPDECYWIANAHRVVAGEYDPAQGPPPDLAVEVDITRRSIDRMKIYASMGIPEVWRYDRKQGLIVSLLSPSGVYKECTLSPTFPDIPLQEIRRHLEMRRELSVIGVIRAFRRWLAGFLGDRPHR